MNSKKAREVLASCIIATVAWHPVSADTVFRDTFDDGDAGDGIPVTWAPLLGTSNVVDGDYVQSGSSPRISLVPKHVIGKTSVRAQVRADKDVGVCLGFRRTPGPNGYAGCLDSDGELDFIRVDGTPVPIVLGATSVPLNVAEDDVRLQIDAMGSELRIWAWAVDEPMPRDPQLVVSDATHPTGSVGMISAGAPSATATYRYVHVADSHISTSDLDCSGDGLVEGVDLDCASAAADRAQFDGILTEIGSLVGDLDFDGEVDFADFLRFSANFNVGTQYSEGDFDWNGTVDFVDFLTFADQFGKVAGNAPLDAVPEPTSIAMFYLGGLIVMASHRRRRSQ